MTLRTLDIFARLCLAVFALLCVAGSATSSLRNHPHSLSYFNEAAGGPENGWKHMLGSSFDCAQDRLLLAELCGRRPEFRGVPCHLVSSHEILRFGRSSAETVVNPFEIWSKAKYLEKFRVGVLPENVEYSEATFVVLDVSRPLPSNEGSAQ